MAEKGTGEEKRKVLGLCLCPACPSWVGCRENGGYCLSKIGASSCITEESGCICGGCEAHNMLGLSTVYYCIRGSEKEQKGK